MKWYLTYFAHALADQASIFMPMGGLYLTSSVISGLEFLFNDLEFREVFLKEF